MCIRDSFNSKRYDLAKVGRYKINRKLGIDAPITDSVLTLEDVVATIKYLVGLHAGTETLPGVRDGKEIDVRLDTDDIDHFGNRRIRAVGELIQNQVRTGLSRMAVSYTHLDVYKRQTGRRSSTSGPNLRPRQTAATIAVTTSSSMTGVTQVGVSAASVPARSTSRSAADGWYQTCLLYTSRCV